MALGSPGRNRTGAMRGLSARERAENVAPRRLRGQHIPCQSNGGIRRAAPSAALMRPCAIATHPLTSTHIQSQSMCVPPAGFEPASPAGHAVPNRARLPVSPRGHAIGWLGRGQPTLTRLGSCPPSVPGPPSQPTTLLARIVRLLDHLADYRVRTTSLTFQVFALSVLMTRGSRAMAPWSEEDGCFPPTGRPPSLIALRMSLPCIGFPAASESTA